MYCESCGLELPKESIVCPFCGFNLLEKNDGGPPVVRLPTPAKNGLSNGIKWSFFLLLPLVVAISLYFFMETSLDLKEIAGKQLSLIQQNKIAEAYYSYTSSDFQKETSLGEFREFLERYPEFFSSKKPRFIDEPASEKQKNIKFSLQSDADDKEAVILHFHFIKEKRDWKIQEIVLYQKVELPEFEDNTNEAFPIANFLQMLKDGQSETAYNSFFSTELKEKTPLKAFLNLLVSHPSLVSFNEFDVQEYSQNAHSGKAVILLNLNHDIDTLELNFIKEKGAWKIFQIHYLTNNLPEKLPVTAEDRGVINAIVFEWLQAMQERNYKKAYEELTSQDFRKESKEEDLEDFAHSFPLIEEHDSVELLEFKIQGDASKLRLLLTKDPKQEELDFSFEKQAGQWKILGIQVIERE